MAVFESHNPEVVRCRLSAILPELYPPVGIPPCQPQVFPRGYPPGSDEWYVTYNNNFLFLYPFPVLPQCGLLPPTQDITLSLFSFFKQGVAHLAFF